MTNVQRRDRARDARRMTPIETRAGQPAQRRAFRSALTQFAKAEVLDGPVAVRFEHTARIHGTDH